MKIPFVKAHGARNDFLFTPTSELAARADARTAVAICDRHAGVGADGWYVVSDGDRDADLSLRLFNSDGSEAEVSGNGTRCAAAFLADKGFSAAEMRVRTGAGVKLVRLLERRGNWYLFEMNMGRPEVRDPRRAIALRGGEVTAAIVDVGNPQCAVVVKDFPADWKDTGRELESHGDFPNRTNVSFVRVVDDHTIEVRFFERGAGPTQSSGTGSTGAAAAAIALGLVRDPVKIVTEAGDLDLRFEDGQAWLVGPAQIVGKGEFYL